MQPALNLTKQERLCFMQALNAVAYRKNNPKAIWLDLLRRFSELLAIPQSDYPFQAGVSEIAEKLNQISNPRARLYFLRIIHDINDNEPEDQCWPWPIDKDQAHTSFKCMYEQLVEYIELK
ncbi:hypothetical protein [Desulfuromonas thiophila]|uniref:hypothetical protein n=1 Tax=Desulfuromonas thiophila TaxID=57664 RepID=UPI0024A9666F|nr:hypothetical protein [Desulfuromonas thiophila]